MVSDTLPSRRLSTRVRRGLWVSGISAAICLILVALAGYFERDPVHLYPAKGRPRPISVVSFSGDMGLRFLLGASTSRGLTEHGITTVGISTPAYFYRKRMRAEIDAFVANNIRNALSLTGTRRIVVIGQSYGADIVQTGLAHLPQDLRQRVAAIILILPGTTVFYRGDPTSLEYDHSAPDAYGITTAQQLTWAPLTCIYGQEEDDSLCPHLRIPGSRAIGMPGGHTIKHDAAGLLGHVLDAIDRVSPPTS